MSRRRIAKPPKLEGYYVVWDPSTNLSYMVTPDRTPELSSVLGLAIRQVHEKDTAE